MTSKLKNQLATVREQVGEAYQNGATLRQIGEVHSVSAGTVRNVLLELGIKLRSRGRRKKADLTDPRILRVNAHPLQDEVKGYEGGVF
jgi:hypothetical protein